jgi:hypothetical protein
MSGPSNEPTQLPNQAPSPHEPEHCKRDEGLVAASFPLTAVSRVRPTNSFVVHVAASAHSRAAPISSSIGCRVSPIMITSRKHRRSLSRAQVHIATIDCSPVNALVGAINLEGG